MIVVEGVILGRGYCCGQCFSGRGYGCGRGLVVSRYGRGFVVLGAWLWA